jgi:glycosyltransferase involved in cell wall biosynthesis
MSKLAVFFPIYPFYDYHLSKDVCLFPKYFYNTFFDSIEILITGEKKTDDIKKDCFIIRNINIDSRIYKQKFNFPVKYHIKCILKSFFYLLKARTISHIMLYHITHYTIYFGFLIKLFFPNIKLYIKMDTAIDGSQYLDKLLKNNYSIKTKIKRWLFSKIELISIETSAPFNILVKNPWLKKIELIPNGFDDKTYKIIPEKLQAEKENIIITVGRLGTYQKNTEILLDIFHEINLYNWKIFFIGPIESDKIHFKNIQQFNKNISFIGNISDRSILYDYYKKAKVFLCPSRFESFGIAMLEAAAFGDYIITTDVGAARDITNNGEYGYICPESLEFNQNELLIKENIKKQLIYIINEEIIPENCAIQQSQFIFNNFSMSNIIKKKAFLHWV